MHAEFLENGTLSQQNPEAAFRILYGLAESGCRDGDRLLAKYYYDGRFIEPDLLKAIKLALPGAKNGDVENQMLLSKCYAECPPPNKSAEQSFYWLSQAAKSGDPEILITLAMYYLNGRGTPKSSELALKNLTLAIQKGSNDARLLLSNWYKKGICVQKNRKKAKELLKEYKAVSKGR
jgi:TPR repeat protein